MSRFIITVDFAKDIFEVPVWRRTGVVGERQCLSRRRFLPFMGEFQPATVLLETFRNKNIKPVPIKSLEQQTLMALHRLRSGWMAARTARLTPREDSRYRVLGGLSRDNITGMTKAAEAVLAEALRLHARARAEVASEILASLDGPADPDAESAWADEIRRRVADVESDAAELEPWDEVKRRVEKAILRR